MVITVVRTRVRKMTSQKRRKKREEARIQLQSFQEPHPLWPTEHSPLMAPVPQGLSRTARATAGRSMALVWLLCVQVHLQWPPGPDSRGKEAGRGRRGWLLHLLPAPCEREAGGAAA